MAGRRGSTFIVWLSWHLLLVPGVALCAVETAWAEGSKYYEINLPRESVAAALNGLSEQANMPVVFPFDLAKTRISNPVIGRYTLLEALAALLKGTGLSGGLTDKGVLTISSAASATTDGETKVPQNENSETKPIKSTHHLAQIATFFATLGAAFGAVSQDSSVPESGKLTEIVVTAQKRAERIQDVPISVVALTSDELAKRNITSIDDLSTVVPGLSSWSGIDQRLITIRGIGNIFGSSSLVGVYLDEASATSGPQAQLDLRTYDLDRVEVLRGPQGTLYGEGSVGGTIRFITKNPVLDRFEMDANVAALFTENGAPGQRIESVVNVPLVEDELGVRVAGTFEHQGGWVDQPQDNSKNFNGQDVADVRLKALWQAASSFRANVMAVIHRNSGSSGEGEDAFGNYTQVGKFTTTPQTEDDYDLFNATLTYDFPSAQLLNTTSYVKQDTDQRNRGYRQPTSGPPETTPLDALYFNEAFSTRVLSEELRLTSTGSGPWQWTIGGFFRHYRTKSLLPPYYYGADNVIGPGDTNDLYPQFDSANESKSAAIFGDTSYQLGRLTLGAGLRYFHDDENAIDNYDPFQSGSFHTLNPRVYAQYKLTQQVNLYSSASKGFRSGGFNSFGLPSYGPESVWTYEFGAKMDLLDRALQLDASVFLSHYDDYLVSGEVVVPVYGAVTTESNNGKARIKGVEATVTWRPLENWSLSVTGDLLDTKFVEVNTLPKPDGTPSSPDAVGDPIDSVPKYQFAASVERDFRVNARPGFARLDYSQQGKEYYRNRNIGPWFLGTSDIINILNFNCGMDWTEQLHLGVFAKNLLNDRGFPTAFNIVGQAERVRPRTYGIQFGVKFN